MENPKSKAATSTGAISPSYEKYEIRHRLPNPKIAALLVIDMQNYFSAMAKPIFSHILTTIRLCRAASIPVIFTRHAHASASDNPILNEWWNGDIILDGTHAADLISDLDREDADEVIRKSTYSAFRNTRLEDCLKEKGVEEVIVTGVMTNICCETTAREAFVRGYRVFFSTDATATVDLELHEATLKNLAYGFAYLVDCKRLGEISAMEKTGRPCNNSEVVDLEDEREARIDPQLEIVEPVIGMKFSSVEETYQFYVNYATKIGFTVRKQYHKKKKNGIVSRASFCCSKEGFRQVNKRKEFVHYTRPISRTGCEASLACLLGKNGQYRVVSFKENHNHDLGKTTMKRTMNVDMNISNAQKVHDADSSRTSFKATMGLINKEVDGRERMGFEDRDYINYIPIEKKARIEKGEVEALVQYFEKKQRDNSSIFYALQLNEDNMVANIFWTDVRSMYDYECFGDVICFDTTYRSSELGRPFTPFFGVNHHKQSAIFGAALLYDETIESLKWLFNTFLGVMSRKQPKTILTNQSTTIAKAICDVFPEAQHRLCVWHIFQSAAKTLSHVFHGPNQFVQVFSSCLFDYENEDDWLLAWQKMLDKYALTDNKWLTYLFELREKWAIVYGRHAFTADMKSTQRSESMNEVLKNYLRPDYDILQFLQQYDRFLADRRCEEMVADFKMNHTTPILPMDTEMLLHMVDIYTPAIFKLFEKEYMNILSCSTFKIGKFDGVSEYKVLLHGSSCHWLVKYEASTQTVTCSCMKFTSTGILCSHALKVLDRKNVKKLPASYILKRWTRDARASNTQTLKVCGKSTGERYNHLCRKFYQITSLAAEHEKLFEHASQTFVQLLKDLEEMKKNLYRGK